MNAPTKPGTLTRAEFRSLIDPLLAALGFTAEQIVSCSFDFDGFTIVAFHQDEAGHRVLGRTADKDGNRVWGGYAKATVAVPVEPLPEWADDSAPPCCHTPPATG